MDLETLRNELDGIDAELTGLFKKRMEICGQIAAFKAENNVPVMNRGRERQVLARVSEIAGPAFANYARILYSSIFDLSRSYQDTLIAERSALKQKILGAMENTDKVFPKEAIVACQGVEGANSQIACDKVFGFANIMFVKNFEGVFNAVEKGLCKYGVLPIENSSHGSVNAVYDLMSSHKFYIVRGLKLHIDHKLLAKKGTDFAQIREVFSHEQAIGQCSSFLAANPQIKVTIVENTAAAAKMVAEGGRTDAAAIASADCANLYGLSILRSDVQDTDNNYTRFIVISKNLEIYPGGDKISMMFSVNNTPGALQRLIARFSSQSLNMTKLESCPVSGRNFEFIFFLELEASVREPGVLPMLEELERSCASFLFLGGYAEV